MTAIVPVGYSRPFVVSEYRGRRARMEARAVADPGTMSPAEWHAMEAAKLSDQQKIDSWYTEQVRLIKLPSPTGDIRRIQEAVCRAYRVSFLDLISKRRTSGIVFPRQVAVYLSKMLTPHSIPEIGRRFGGRDHSTINHGVRKIAQRRSTDPQLDAALSRLERRLYQETAS